MNRNFVSLPLLVALLAACQPSGTTPPAATDAAATSPATAMSAEAVDSPAAPAAPEPAAGVSAGDGMTPDGTPADGEASGAVAGDAAQPRCEDNPLATYLFTLVKPDGNAVDGCGRYDAKVAGAFDALLADMGQAGGPKLRQRLLSGPSAAGRPLQVEGRTWWYYTACQAHQCNSTRLTLLFDAERATMVGRLVTRCQAWWPGDPDPEQRAVIEREDPVDLEALKADGDCGGDP
ncbi:Ivy family c-type lysozyme inhibitor [Stenotrophomonas sp. 24(2023)]|uniref:Ivy family c-type lysozyme inhibitor n=1 Tax=Stenotrophomonas sp. 24(2023) TaxID=3068324 RepID=UPI0027DFDCD2|nr:Ivy family c-type lysozyme inhibitor [Stenotrophomonas sp. 24(2023)]WMJ69520.1 Ivy family c-type lysozyme inhibitor [Stenotrophomonas sp. 24(2023)]